MRLRHWILSKLIPMPVARTALAADNMMLRITSRAAVMVTVTTVTVEWISSRITVSTTDRVP